MTEKPKYELAKKARETTDRLAKRVKLRGTMEVAAELDQLRQGQIRRQVEIINRLLESTDPQITYEEEFQETVAALAGANAMLDYVIGRLEELEKEAESSGK